MGNALGHQVRERNGIPVVGLEADTYRQLCGVYDAALLAAKVVDDRGGSVRLPLWAYSRLKRAVERVESDQR